MLKKIKLRDLMRTAPVLLAFCFNAYATPKIDYRNIPDVIKDSSNAVGKIAFTNLKIVDEIRPKKIYSARDEGGNKVVLNLVGKISISPDFAKVKRLKIGEVYAIFLKINEISPDKVVQGNIQAIAFPHEVPTSAARKPERATEEPAKAEQKVAQAPQQREPAQAGQEVAQVPQQREPAQAGQEVAQVPQPLKNKQSWSGYYVCKQGTTSLILRINSVSEIKNTDILNVKAIFDFDYADGQAVGKFNLYGQYNPKSRTLLLNPGEWMQRPPGYESVGMDGKISSDGKHYTGKIRPASAGCSEFDVSLDERAQAERKVAQVPQQREPAQKGALPRPTGKQAPTGTSNKKGGESAAGALACLGLSGTCLFVPLGIFVLNIAIMIWVVRDAKARGAGSPIGWLILVILTGIIGLIIYFFSRPKGELVICPSCKNKRLQAMAKCPHCGN